ncbi:hypothetical protein A4X09_0g5726 [Tilletia walkeri]|uniref:Ndc10 domain-containing protein n=1 Tax=Tilletia walkeri TaxID=117179 RepID=A0A8X7N3Y8_9BASI|nr:hypothetical protein A4X09_0g5726 [Tilletia walkeri]
MEEAQTASTAAHAAAAASTSAVMAEKRGVRVGGRTTKVRSDGVAYTEEKKMIAVFLTFGAGDGKKKNGENKRKREEAVEKLGCASTALYRWKKIYPDAARARDKAIDANTAVGSVLKTIRSRSDEEKFAAFLLPEFSVPMPSRGLGGGPSNSAGKQVVVRPDGLGPTAEFGPGSMSAELLACLRLVDDGTGEITEEERVQLSTVGVEEDVPEAGEDLVSHSLTLGAKLAYTNLAKGTSTLWKGPQQRFTSFWRALAALRAETDEEKVAAQKTEVLATEQKLVTWLNCSVLFRNPTLGYEAIRTHVKAINNLWTQQNLEGRNDHPQPGAGSLCSQYLRAVKLHQADLARLTNTDKFRNSLPDGYDEAGFLSISQWYAQRASGRGNGYAAIRDRFAFLWQHAIMGRSEDLRERELSDFYSAELPHSKPHPSIVIVSTQLKSKSNRDARPERGVAARHRDVEVCAVGALAQYLFYRFHVQNEFPLDFSSRDSWYRVKLLVDDEAKDNTVGVTWAVQAVLLRQAFDKCSISSSHLTHAMRSGGAQFASAAGCTEDAIRKHGRWCGDRLMERYLTSVTLQPIRALSGFSIIGEDYWLPRTVIDPPTTLSQQIFPWIEAKYEQVKTRSQTGGEADGAALQFLDMLTYVWVVLLQDSVLLREKIPSFPLWDHPPFNTAGFATFAQTLTQTINTTTSPFDISVTQLVPSLGTALGHVRSELSALTGKIEKLDGRSEEQQRRHDEQFGALAANMDGITQLFVAAQQSEQRLNAARAAVAESLRTLSLLSCQLSGAVGFDAARNNSTLVLDSAFSTSSPTSSTTADGSTGSSGDNIGLTATSSSFPLAITASSFPTTSHHTPASLPSLTISTTLAAPLALPAAAAAAASAATALGIATDYRLPSVASVAALWQEWSAGREGRLALGVMDAAGDIRLRGSSSMKQQVYRWRKICGFIKEVGEEKATETVAALDRILAARKGGLRLLA